MTMNDSWGWVPKDRNYKSSTQIIHTLCEIVGKGGNFLLNVSPMGDGSHPRRADRAARRGHHAGWRRIARPSSA